MAKKKSSAAAAPAPTVSRNNSSAIQFPSLSPKEYVECSTLLEDQILLIDVRLANSSCSVSSDVLNNMYCWYNRTSSRPKNAKHSYASSRAYRLSSPHPRRRARRNESTVRQFPKFSRQYQLVLTCRNQPDRISVTSPEFAQKLHAVISSHLPSFPYPASVRRSADDDDAVAGRAPRSLNSNIRMYKYTTGQHFGPHYDDSVRDPVTGDKSEWTLLVYLSGAQDGVEGGEVSSDVDVVNTTRPDLTSDFILQATSTGQASGGHHSSFDPRNGPLTPVSPSFIRAIERVNKIDRHGHECLLHEGSPVVKGTKYILRSDLMFKS